MQLFMIDEVEPIFLILTSFIAFRSFVNKCSSPNNMAIISPLTIKKEW